MARTTSRTTAAVTVRRFAMLVARAVALWIVGPSALASVGRFPQLGRVSIGWFVGVGLLEVLALACMWQLIRLALETDRWFDVICSQLAANALSRALPGGAATGGALQYQMLTTVGFDTATTTSALTATGLLSTGMLFVLPFLAAPSLLAGLAVGDRLSQGLVLAAVLGVFLFAGGATLVFSDRVVTRSEKSSTGSPGSRISSTKTATRWRVAS